MVQNKNWEKKKKKLKAIALRESNPRGIFLDNDSGFSPRSPVPN